jgi:hypothetical protein
MKRVFSIVVTLLAFALDRSRAATSSLAPYDSMIRMVPGITNNNATTITHGFVGPLSGDSSKYIGGDNLEHPLPGGGGGGSGDMLAANNLSDLANKATAKRNLHLRVVDVRDFGVVDNGSTDDTAAVQSAAATLQNGDVFQFGIKTRVKTTGTNAVITLQNLTNVTVRGHVVTSELGMSDPAWKTISALTATGTVAYATLTAHGFSAGSVVLVYCSGDTNYNGPITILSAGLDANHFAYNTLGGSPGAGSGTMQATAPDYQRTIIRLVNCQSPNIDDITYTGQYVDDSDRSRFGYTVVRADDNGATNDNRGGRYTGKIYGAAYAGWVEYYNAPRLGGWVQPFISLDCVNVGYGMASWGGLDHAQVWISGDDVHRVMYAGALRNAELHLRGKNFDITALDLTTASDGTNHWGSENNRIFVTDTGTTRGASFFQGANRYLVELHSEDAFTQAVYWRNNRINVNLSVGDTYGQGISAVGIVDSGKTNSIFENTVVSGTIDRSAVTTLWGSPSFEFFGRSDGEIGGLHFQDFEVINSSVTATNANFKRDIAFSNNTKGIYFDNATTDSQNAFSVTGGKIYDRDRIGYYLPGSAVLRYDDPSTKSLMFSIGGNAIFPSVTMDVGGSATNQFRNGNFTNNVSAATMTVTNDVYDATAWASSTNVPTKKAIRDKIESLSTGSSGFTNVIKFSINGGGGVISSGQFDTRYVAQNLVIYGVILEGDTTGSATVDLRKCTYTQYDAGATHPVSGDSICGGSPATVSSATKSKPSISGWTTTLSTDDYVVAYVSSVSSFTKLNVTLLVKNP